MELYVPSYVLEQLQIQRDEEARARAMELVDDMQSTIYAATPRLAAVADEEGGRLMTAAAFMLRANDLLREARQVELHVHVCALALRSVLELSIVGRYFVVGKNGADEFARRIKDGHDIETKLAEQVDTTNVPLPPFLAEVAATVTKAPRQLSVLATELDRSEQREPGEEGSLLYMYRLLYKFVSNVLTHANAMSIKRYTVRHGDAILLQHATEPAVTTPNIVATACLLCDLARDVFDALDVSSDGLPDVFRRPLPGLRA